MEIKLSKVKIFLSFIISFLVLLLGIYTVIFPEEVSSFLKMPFLAVVVGVMTCLLALSFLIMSFMALIKNTGLIINSEGIVDNSSPIALGLIKWEDILRIRKIQISSITFLLIDLKNQEKYLKDVNKLKAWWLRVNARSYGTPISINAAFLTCKFSELEDIITNAHEKYLNDQDW